jgi:serine/threonine protein kinase
VRSRSTELSHALARLATRRSGADTLRGTLIGGRFRLGDLLGAGGMGAVYAGVDTSTGAPVAVKVIPARSAGHLDGLHRFLREARVAAAITHPAVVRMLHVDVSEDGLFFQVQELVNGETLTAVLHTGARPSAPAAARLVSVLCSALAAAHAEGVVHRDVKPSNIMLTEAAPGLRLVDFGISKLAGDEFVEEVTRVGAVLGTPAYMSPEQRAGSPDLAGSSDVY